MNQRTTNLVNFTDANIKALALPEGCDEFVYRDTVQKGLVLRVMKNGTRTYYLRARVGGGMKNRKIGTPSSVLTPAKARRMAEEIILDIRAGNDPRKKRLAEAAEKKRADNETKSLSDAIDFCIAKRKVKGRTRSDYESLRDNELAPYAKTTINTITRSVAVDWLNEIAQAIRGRKKGVTGHSRANKAIRLVRSAMIASNLDNPCVEDAGDRFPWFPERARECFLEPQHAQSLWQNLSAAGSEERAAYFGTLLLTGMRSGEALNLRACDVDLGVGVITLRQTKNGSTHRVYVSTQLADLLRPILEKKKPTQALFPTCEHIAPQLHKACVAAKAPKSSNHDLRKLWAITALDVGVAYPVIKKALNHSSKGDVTMVHYAQPTPSQLRGAWQNVADYVTEGANCIDHCDRNIA